MTSLHDRWTRAEAILFEVALLPEHERMIAVTRMCCNDSELEREVNSLLEHARVIGDFLEQPALGRDFSLLPATADTRADDVGEADEMLGRTVGSYRIERHIASGGMGTVYVALRADAQFTQRVALKIVKRGMDTDEILKRFRRERQTLAALEHPNIARLIDGGSTERGQPFLVMEFVDGEPIDAYCDRHQLDIDARLRLFLVVCDAVRFAHQNLVVHRDLKPGNILVTREGIPKLLDFGIATVIGAARMRHPTSAEERRLTPEYASPEQIAGGAVATTSDVYSLGVILYELLSGGRPYYLTTRTPEEIQRAVIDTQPCAPSAALRGEKAKHSASETSRLRCTTPEQLARRLRGDLDTIVLAAMRKAPQRRYASVEQLAADVRRHLDRMPVLACRDTFAYRTSKFLQRHALASAFTMISLVLLVTGALAFAWQARVARRERDRAVLARSQTEAIDGFLQNMFASVNPARSGRGVTVQEVLHEAAQRLDSELRDQPLVQAALRETIGSTYLALGFYDEAELQLREAYRVRLEQLGERHVDVAESMVNLATLLHAKRSFDEAGAMLERALDIYREIGDPNSAGLATTLTSLGAVRRAQGRLEDAEGLQREALDFSRRSMGDESLEVAQSLNNLASVLSARQRYDEAQAALERALRIRRERLGADHPLVAQSMDNLAVLLSCKNDLDAAEPLYNKALELEIRLLGATHVDVAVTRSNLARLLVARGHLEEAESQLRMCLDAREAALGPSDARCVFTQLDLAELLLAEGQSDTALPFAEAALEAIRDASFDANLRSAVIARGASIFAHCGQDERAAELRRELQPK